MTMPPTTAAAVLALWIAPGVAFATQEADARDGGGLPTGVTMMALDGELRPSMVRVTSILDGGVAGEDQRGRPVVFEAGEFVALVRINPRTDLRLGIGVRDLPIGEDMPIERASMRAQASALGVLATTDQRRYPGGIGVYVEDSAEETFEGVTVAESVMWIGDGTVLEFDLDDLAFVVREGAPASVRLTLPKSVNTDTLLLTNGDIIGGFIAGVGSGVELERDDGSLLTLEMERVHAMVFANPTEPSAPTRAWFDDGSVLGDRSVQTSGGRWVTFGDGADGTADAAWNTRPLTSLRAIAFDADRLVPLSDLTPDRVVSDTPGATITLGVHPDDALLDEAPALGAFDVLMGSPMRVAYALPDGAARFACSVTLAYPDSAWADCQVVFAVDGVEASRTALGRESPIASINIALPSDAQTMTITLDEGRFGPVHDALRLARPLFLLSD